MKSKNKSLQARGYQLRGNADGTGMQEILNLAKEESDKLGNRHIGTEHLLLGMIESKASLAGRLLRERRRCPGNPEISGQIPAPPDVGGAAQIPQVKEGDVSSENVQDALGTLENFLYSLKSNNAEESALHFAENAQFIDSTGKRWVGRDEIKKQFEILFAPYAKKNVSFRMRRRS